MSVGRADRILRKREQTGKVAGRAPAVSRSFLRSKRAWRFCAEARGV